MKGRVCMQIARLQHAHLASSESLLNSGMWMRMLISKLLHMSHAQWLLHNFMLHDTTTGFLRLKDRLELVTKIAELSSTNPESIPEESRFLLEIDTNRLVEGDFDGQDYWVHAMEAALSTSRNTSTGRHAVHGCPTSHAAPLGPQLSIHGTFFLLNEIRRERSTRTRPGEYHRVRRPPTIGLSVSESEAHLMAKLASNRRWKPD